ncbi:PAS domain-containing protein, partial [Campylobacter fetus subsp. venerealis]
GYTLDQIKGQHHRMFCSSEEANSREYHAFWQALATGESQHGRYKRINSHGEEIWLEATYLPVKNRRGKILRVFKVANDVT